MYIGTTNLILASKEGYLDVVKFLVENGAGINAKNKEGNLLYTGWVKKYCN